MGKYLDFCLNNSIMVACPDRNCNAHYTHKCIPKKMRPTYSEVCYKYLTNFAKSKIEKLDIYYNAVKYIRRERIEFIQKNIPAAISCIISVIYMKEINTVKKKTIDNFRNCWRQPLVKNARDFFAMVPLLPFLKTNIIAKPASMTIAKHVKKYYTLSTDVIQKMWPASKLLATSSNALIAICPQLKVTDVIICYAQYVIPTITT